MSIPIIDFHRLRIRCSSRFAVACAIAAFAVNLAAGSAVSPRSRNLPPPIPIREFASMVVGFSEEGGSFRSDNFVSNETSYLHVIHKLPRLDSRDGAYIGVGPEQNFSYIARVRPKVAFIVDIRRQAVLQHLMYKALFSWSKNRTRFLEFLFSRRLKEDDVSDPAGGITGIFDMLEKQSAAEPFFERNFERVIRTIEGEYGISLSETDRAGLKYILSAFRDEGPEIRYRFGGPGWPGNPWSQFPTFREIALEKDLSNHLGGFLATEESYQYIRALQARNRIIPVVGDFAGGKALASISRYLKERDLRVEVFYTSNVEQFLFNGGTFVNFAGNIRQLPLSARSVFIRSFSNMRESHPARIAGHRMTTLLQNMRVFLEDFDGDLYSDYRNLALTHYIAGNSP
jgi:hypothetical protein